MNKKLQYLIEYSLLKKIKSKSFIISNIIILIALLLLCNIDTVIKFFGGNFGEKINVYVVDETDVVYNKYDSVLKESFKNGTNEYSISLSDKSIDDLKNTIEEEKKDDIILNIKDDEDNIFYVNIISYGYIESTVYESLTNAINMTKYNIALEKSNITLEEIDKIEKKVLVNREIINKELNEEEEIIKTLVSVIIPIFILPFFMLILMVVGMVGSEINEEKSSRSMEIIISSVSPKIHFAAKIISVNLWVLIQGVLLILFVFLAGVSRILISGPMDANGVSNVLVGNNMDINRYLEVFLNSDLLNSIIRSLPLILIIFILSFIAYSLLAGILASMTTSMDDYQQVQTPLTFILLAGYYISMFAGMYDSSVFIKIVSYIPFLSAIISPSLILTGGYSFLDLIICIVLLIVTIMLLIKYGSRVYKVGILNYSPANMWKKIGKALKQK